MNIHDMDSSSVDAMFLHFNISLKYICGYLLEAHH